jgi:hypothetical protein
MVTWLLLIGGSLFTLRGVVPLVRFMISRRNAPKERKLFLVEEKAKDENFATSSVEY